MHLKAGNRWCQFSCADFQLQLALFNKGFVIRQTGLCGFVIQLISGKFQLFRIVFLFQITESKPEYPVSIKLKQVIKSLDFPF
jgi:hypothetical protein